MKKMHAKVMYLFKEYLLVGGMPQALKAYKNGNKDFYAADVEKRDILELYRDDIKKAAKRVPIQECQLCLRISQDI